MEIDWNAIKWFCLGLAGGLSLHHSDVWAWIFFGCFIVASILAPVATGYRRANKKYKKQQAKNMIP